MFSGKKPWPNQRVSGIIKGMKHASEAGFGISLEKKLHTENVMLRMRNEALHGQVDALQTALEQAEAVRQQQVAELQSKLAFFEEQMRLARERMFGKSSEQHVLEQINLFNEAESEADCLRRRSAAVC